MLNHRYRFMLLVLLVVGLAIFFTDGFGFAWLRSYGGDIIAVMFLYSFARFVGFSQMRSFVICLVLAFGVEFIQLMPTPQQGGLVQELFIGATFDFFDLLVYIVGAFAVFSIDKSLAEGYLSNS